MTQALKRGLFGYRPGSVKAILADREQMFSIAARESQVAQSQNEELTAELGSARLELETAKAELETVRAELETTQVGRDAAEADLETVRAERDAVNAERDTLVAELVKARTDRDAARSQLTERERLLDDATARSERLDSELEGARTRERQEGERARKATAEMTTIRRELAEANARVLELEQELERRGTAGEAATAITTSGELDRVLLETESTINRIVAEARHGAERELAEIERRREVVRAEVDALVARRDRLAPLAENVRELLGVAQARTQEADTRLRTALEPLTATVGELRGRLIELMDEAERDDDIEVVTSEEEEGAAGSPTDEPPAVIHLADGPRSARSPW